ncbi:MAG: TPM domain-containing protein [Gemmataceae bacterium]|nr:TPM domain-containing protein [Gemmataceae bacterium]MDW8265911.1 TPM domain-containing protein [Gemmataceae bacterium]
MMPMLMLLCGATLAEVRVEAPFAVKDDANFFSRQAVDQANSIIADIKRRYKEDLAIETYPAVPDDRRADLERGDRNAFFHEWARSRARALQVTGVYVLICRQPSHLQVEVGNHTQQRAFTLRDRDELVRLMLDRFRRKEYDQGLLQAATFVRDTLARNLGPGRHTAATPGQAIGGAAAEQDGTAPGAGGWDWLGGLGGLICVALAIAGLVWVIIAIIRAIAGAGGGYPARATNGGPPYAGGGGGFWSSLLGGLFGAAAGNWMYDHFFRSGPSSSGSDWGASNAYAAGGDEGLPPPQDTDYSGAGGDFGSGADSSSDSFGGGDLGGGDFGGDLGGGDFGGGDF